MDKEQERIAMEQVVKELDTEIASQFGQQLAELRARLEEEKKVEDFEESVINRLDQIINLLDKIASNTY